MISEGDLLLCGSALYTVVEVEQSAFVHTLGPTGETVIVTLTDDAELPDDWTKIDRQALGERLDSHLAFLVANPDFNDETPLRGLIVR